MKCNSYLIFRFRSFRTFCTAVKCSNTRPRRLSVYEYQIKKQSWLYNMYLGSLIWEQAGSLPVVCYQRSNRRREEWRREGDYFPFKSFSLKVTEAQIKIVIVSVPILFKKHQNVCFWSTYGKVWYTFAQIRCDQSTVGNCAMSKTYLHTCLHACKHTACMKTGPCLTHHNTTGDLGLKGFHYDLYYN